MQGEGGGGERGAVRSSSLHSSVQHLGRKDARTEKCPPCNNSPGSPTPFLTQVARTSV